MDSFNLIMNLIHQAQENETSVCSLRCEVGKNHIYLWSIEKDEQSTAFFYSGLISDIEKAQNDWRTVYSYDETKKKVVAKIYNQTASFKTVNI